MLPAAAGLPDPLVRLIPVLAHPLDDPRQIRPGCVRDRRRVLVEEVDGVDQLAVDVELELVGGAVPDPDRGRAHVALEVRQHLLVQLRAAVDPVHDLERPRLAADALPEAVGEPVHEPGRLLGEAEPEQCVEREGGVADPGVAVVPVPPAADLLGQARRRRGDHRARRLVGEQLQHERGAVDGLPPAAPVPRLREPAAPERDRVLEVPARLVLGERASGRRSRAPSRARRSRSRRARA